MHMASKTRLDHWSGFHAKQAISTTANDGEIQFHRKSVYSQKWMRKRARTSKLASMCVIWLIVCLTWGVSHNKHLELHFSLFHVHSVRVQEIPISKSFEIVQLFDFSNNFFCLVNDQIKEQKRFTSEWLIFYGNLYNLSVFLVRECVCNLVSWVCM